MNDDGIQSYNTLDTLLQKEELVDAMGPDIAFDLWSLLTRKDGPNLRNLLAHGLIPDVQVRQGAASVYVWHLALRLLILAKLTALRGNENVASGSAGADPVSSGAESAGDVEDASGVKERGTFDPAGRAKAVHEVESIEPVDAPQPEYDTSAVPLWQTIAEIAKGVPERAWSSVADDLSERVDDYIYPGGPGQDEF